MHLSFLNRQRVLAATLLSLACKQDAPMTRGQEPAEPAAADAISIPAYPRARWRLVDPTGLDDVVLWVSQILIRHEQADRDPAFQVADWHSESPGAKRSRGEALVLARELREQAWHDPTRFGELASSHSEDVATRSRAGSLGGISASQLLLWPKVLDALAATPIGQVSEVIETQYGFHILLRRAPPREDTVSGAHIVIAHQAAGWIRILGRREAPLRSREQALTLANQLYEEARRTPEAFSTLVERYSEHRDAERGGDMGTWSTREPTFYPREVEILGGLAVGEIAPPVDSPVGFQILQRTPNRPRERFAMDEIHLYFDPSSAEPDPTSQQSVRAKATRLALELRAAPSRFYDLRNEVCCSFSDQWDEGRGSPALTDALSRLEIGQITPEPIRTEFSYVIAKRVPPPAGGPPSVRFELPQPSAPDIAGVLQARDDGFLMDELRIVGEEVLGQLPLSPSAAQQIALLHSGTGRFEGLDTRQSRRDAFNRLLNDVEKILGPVTYARYLALLDAHFERVVLADR
jgi:hypothetical protein